MYREGITLKQAMENLPHYKALRDTYVRIDAPEFDDPVWREVETAEGPCSAMFNGCCDLTFKIKRQGVEFVWGVDYEKESTSTRRQFQQIATLVQPKVREQLRKWAKGTLDEGAGYRDDYMKTINAIDTFSDALRGLL